MLFPVISRLKPHVTRCNTLRHLCLSLLSCFLSPSDSTPPPSLSHAVLLTGLESRAFCIVNIFPPREEGTHTRCISSESEPERCEVRAWLHSFSVCNLSCGLLVSSRLVSSLAHSLLPLPSVKRASEKERDMHTLDTVVMVLKDLHLGYSVKCKFSNRGHVFVLLCSQQTIHFKTDYTTILHGCLFVSVRAAMRRDVMASSEALQSSGVVFVSPWGCRRNP